MERFYLLHFLQKNCLNETFAQLYLVMLNLFQHLIISVSYETLKQVQGDNYGIMQRSLNIISKYAKN